MVKLACPYECGYKTEDVTEATALQILQLHAKKHAAEYAVETSRGQKLCRPTIDIGTDEEGWMMFQRHWETYKAGSRIGQGDAAIQLFECASAELKDLILKIEKEINLQKEADVLTIMRSLAVIPTARGVIRAELLKLEQMNDESFRKFAARVRGKAETCGFSITVEHTCNSCNTISNVRADYTQESMRDVLLAGIADIDIRREALSCEDLQAKSINELISFVERREMSRHATTSNSVSAISSFKRSKQHSTPQTPDYTQQTRACPKCGRKFKPFKRGKYGINKKPFAECFECWRGARGTRNCSQLQVTEVINDVTSQEVTPVVLSHDIFANGQCTNSKHPKISLMVRHLRNDKATNVVCIADSGAQSNLWSLSSFNQSGFSVQDLDPVTISISAANNHRLKIIGAFYAEFEGVSPSGARVTCRDLVYVSDSVDHFYLSYDTMKRLAILDDKFPTVGDSLSLPDRTSGEANQEKQHIRGINLGCPQASTDSNPCKCPERSAVPSRPNKLPYDPIPANNEKMRKWLLKTFAACTFNTCPHRPLTQMKGPPIEIHVDERAEPRVCHTASPIPIHW
ncbi:MAG: hypothetical protein AAFO91_04065, partial [Bacteroidota bacterium]